MADPPKGERPAVRKGPDLWLREGGTKKGEGAH